MNVTNLQTHPFNPGIFCISLDFELHWGTFERVQLNEYGRKRFLNTRQTIPKMLDLFDKYGISVTWAAVGMLFNETVQEWIESKPAREPSYVNKDVSSYGWIEKNGFEEEPDPYHFAPELISKILLHPNMELGTHTYSHFYCQEPGQTVEDFKIDLELALAKAAKFGIELKSLVFPRNQFNESYLGVCKDCGISTVRTNPDVWFWDLTSKQTILNKVYRALDSFIPLDLITSISLKDLDISQLPFQLPASRFFRPWSSISILNRLKMKRILDEMTHAAENGELYHLWWHPHNFGNNPQQCLAELETILNHFSMLKNRYGFMSLHMNGVRDYLIKNQI